MAEIYAVMSGGIDEALFNASLGCVDANKRYRINAFRRREDAENALMADLLARFAASASLNMKMRDIKFSYTHRGKPFIEEQNRFFFNLSHSRGLVLCAAGRSELGIDVEYMDEIDPFFPCNFLSGEEYARMLALSPPLRQAHFYRLWTVKESFVKAKGEGLFIPLDSMSVEINSDLSVGFKSITGCSGYCFRIYEPAENFTAALCCREKTPDKVSFLEKNEIINRAVKEYRA